MHMKESWVADLGRDRGYLMQHQGCERQSRHFVDENVAEGDVLPVPHLFPYSVFCCIG